VESCVANLQVENEIDAAQPKSSLVQWRNDTAKDAVIRITVLRKNFQKSVQAYLRQPSFSFFNQPKIVFIGEVAVDDGGPRREFFRQVFLVIRKYNPNIYSILSF